MSIYLNLAPRLLYLSSHDIIFFEHRYIDMCYLERYGVLEKEKNFVIIGLSMYKTLFGKYHMDSNQTGVFWFFFLFSCFNRCAIVTTQLSTEL